MTQRYQVQQAICFFFFGLLTLSICSLYVANQLVVAASKKAAMSEVKANKQIAAVTSKEPSYRVYLTFDDGPSATTDAVLDILQEQQIPATFFVIGATSAASPPRYQRMIAEGHTIGLHSYSHNYNVIYRSVEDYIADTMRLSDFIYEITKVRPHLYRMPGGGFTCPSWMKREILAHFESEGYTHYLWNIDPNDAVGETLSAKTLLSRVIEGAKEKPQQDLIVLLHDNTANPALAEALPAIIAYFREQGYSFHPLPQ